jgi:hypothetical protein
MESPTAPRAGETKGCVFIKIQKPELHNSSLDGRGFLSGGGIMEERQAFAGDADKRIERRGEIHQLFCSSYLWTPTCAFHWLNPPRIQFQKESGEHGLQEAENVPKRESVHGQFTHMVKVLLYHFYTCYIKVN